jgi:cysteine sulfinate desulfinase/cysteine desulfurase-like protein
MNLPAAVIDGAIRISFSRFNTNEEADYFVKNLTEAAGKLRTQKR